jgi:hypothetical protein
MNYVAICEILDPYFVKYFKVLKRLRISAVIRTTAIPNAGVLAVVLFVIVNNYVQLRIGS